MPYEDLRYVRTTDWSTDQLPTTKSAVQSKTTKMNHPQRHRSSMLLSVFRRRTAD